MRRIAFGILLLCSVSFLVGGCAVSPQITNTPRSSIEQELLVSSLERGFETLEKQHLAGATVTVDFYGLTPDKDFAKEFLIAWLQAHQVHIVNDPKEAQLRVKVFAPVLGVDQAQSFIGTPSFTVPFLGVTIPEIPRLEMYDTWAMPRLKVIRSRKTVESFSTEVRPRWVRAHMTITQF